MKASNTTQKLDLVQLDHAADRLRSIAHPMRIAIIELLNEKEKLSVTQIYKHLKSEQATISNHLGILRDKGILHSKRDGKKIFYSVNTKTLKAILDTLNRCNAD